MNKFRYMIVAMLVVCSIFNSMLVSMAEEAATTGVDYSLETSILKALEILKSDTKDELKLDDATTRGAFAILLGRVMGLGATEEAGAERTLFSDVASDNSAAKYINALAEMGIMNGQETGKFAPDEAILFEQGLKAVVKSLGYTATAEQKGGYPTGYIGTAVQLKLTRNLNLQIGASLTNGQVMRLIYNALEVDLMEQVSFGNTEHYEAVKGKTLLTERLDIEKRTGQVIANEDTALTGELFTQEKEVIINGDNFKVGNTDAKTFLGYFVDYYYKTDAVTDEKTLLLIRESKNNKALKIKADDISEDTTKSEFNYWIDKDNDEKTKSVKLSDNAKVIYNGKAYGTLSGNAVTINDITPSSGDVTLIDTNGDDSYDIILVTEYETYVTKYVFNSILYDRHSTRTISLDDSNGNKKIIITKDGTKIKPSNISEWDVVEIAQSKNTIGTKLINIKVIQKVVQGTIEEEGIDTIKIEGEKYKIATDYPKNDSMYEYSSGKRGTFYLDIDGKIASSDLFSGSNIKYGYLFQYGMTTGMDAVGQFKIMTSEGEWKIFLSKEKLLFRGENHTASYVVNNLPANKEYLQDGTTTIENKRQIVTYKLNDEEKIIELNTATDYVTSANASTYPGYSDGEFSKDYDSKGAQVRAYIQKINLNYNIDLSITFFAPFPWDAESLKDDETLYGVGKLSTDDKRVLAMYDANEVNEPAAILVYGTKSGSAAGGGSITFEDPVVIFDKLVDALDPNTGDISKKLYYFKNGILESAPLYEPEKLKDTHVDIQLGYNNVKLVDLKKGSALQIGKNSKGEISDIVIFFNADDIKNGVREYSENGVIKDKAFTDVKGRYALFAKVLRKLRSTLLVNAQVDKDGRSDNPLYNKTFITSGIPIYIYDRAKDKITIGSSQDIGLNDMVFIHVVYNKAKVMEIIR